MYISKKKMQEDLQMYVEDIKDSIKQKCYYVANESAVELKGIIFWAYRKKLLNAVEREKWLEIAYHYITETNLEIIKKDL